jgi:hypothetical protein
MTLAKDSDEERREREAERLAQDRRQNAALLAIVKAQTDQRSSHAPANPRTEENRALGVETSNSTT